MSNDTHHPKCPSCSAIGNEHLVSTGSESTSGSGKPWFHTVYCSKCGHVYGVFPKEVFTFELPRKTFP